MQSKSNAKRRKDSGLSLMVYHGVYQTRVLFPGGNPAPVVPGPEFCLARLVGRGRLCGGSVSVTPSLAISYLFLFSHIFYIFSGMIPNGSISTELASRERSHFLCIVV